MVQLPPATCGTWVEVVMVVVMKMKMMVITMVIVLDEMKSKEHELVVDVIPDDHHPDCDGGW